MPSWNNESSASTFDAGASVTGMASNRSSGRTGNSSHGGLIGRVNDLLGHGMYSVVGLNVEAIPGMREAVRNYVQNINATLSAIDPDANASNAYQSSEIQAAVREYIENVKTYCLNLVSQMNAFSDKLQDVSNTYQQFAQQQSQSINSATASNDAGTQYTESIQ